MENEACGFSDFDRGAMRQKMAIFKRGNSVWRRTKNFECEIFMNFIGGRCDKKWRFSNEETAFAGVQKILNGEIFMNFIGGRCDRKWRFSKRETAFAGVQNFVRGDVDENRHFIEGKLVVHYQILNIFEWGRCWWKSSFYWRKIGRTLPNFEYFSMGAMLIKNVDKNFQKTSFGIRGLNIFLVLHIVLHKLSEKVDDFRLHVGWGLQNSETVDRSK